MFLFPDVPVASGSDHVDVPLKQAAHGDAQATWMHCHQRLKHTESLPASLFGDTKKLGYYSIIITLHHYFNILFPII